MNDDTPHENDIKSTGTRKSCPWKWARFSFIQFFNLIVPLLTGLLGIAIIIYFSMWFYAADKIKHEISNFIAESSAHGNRINVKNYTVTGFPGKIRIDIEKIETILLSGETIRIPHISAEAHAWDWRRINFSLPQGGNFLTRHILLDAVQSEHLFGNAYFGRLDGLPEIHLEATNTTISHRLNTLSKFNGFQQRIMAQKLGFIFSPVTPDPESTIESNMTSDSFNLIVTGNVIGLVDSGQNKIMEHTHYIESARFEVFLPIPPPPRLSRERLDQWRRAGGELDIRAMDITWWPVHIVGQGKMHLDEELQPTGRLQVEVTGFNTLINTFAAAGLIGDKQKKMAQIALNLLSVQKPGSNTRVINVPLTLENNVIKLGPVRLMQVSPIIWPGEARIIHR